MRLFTKAAVAAAMMTTLLTAAGANAHVSATHTINGIGSVGPTVTIIGADQLLDTGTVIIGSTTVVLSCVQVISSGPTTHLAGMYGTGGGAAWTITIRQSSAGDFLIVNNAPFANPTNANNCAIGNAGATGTGAFAIV